METNNNADALREKVLESLIRKYSERVRDMSVLVDAMVRERIIGSAKEIQNDHIAFRTLGVENLGVTSLEKIFIHYGWRKRDHYFFSAKKLDAWWYAPPERRPDLPRIFISELRVADLGAESQAVIYSYTDQVVTDPVDGLDLDDAAAIDGYLHTACWRIPSLEDYEFLLSESEYAAWAIYNRYYLNHFTFSVHNLKIGYNTLEQFNPFVEAQGIRLNDAGGKIKRSADGLLLQSSTVAQMVEAVFAGGEKKMIPGSYVEFAERKVLPEFQDLPEDQIRPIHRREGFEAGNADKIFESTYIKQAGKR